MNSMTVEKIQLDIKLERRLTAYKRLAIIWGFIIFLFYVNDPRMTFSASIYAFIGGVFFLSIWVFIFQMVCAIFGLGFIGKNNKKIKKELINKGFRVDYSISQFAIDDYNKKFFFINAISGEVSICDYCEIRSWHQIDNIDGSTGSVLSCIVIRTSDPNYPEFRVGSFSEKTASTWIARISSLINN